MNKVLVADPIIDDGVALLRREAEVDVCTGLPNSELVRIIPDYDALMVRSETRVTPEIIAAGGKLRAIGRAGVGVDNIDLDAATERGIVVVNAPTGNTISTAEHAIGLMLALARHIPEANASLKAGEWDRSRFTGVELRGKTLGIIGLGRVGSEVARRAKGLDMHVVAYDPPVSAERAAMLGVELADSVTEVVERSDFLTLHAALTPQTRHIIGERELQQARPTLRVINAARGELVDYDALVKAIDERRVAGAALDVFPNEPKGKADRDGAPFWSHPVLNHERIIVTPHLAASTAEAQERVAIDVAEQILAVLRGEPAEYAVNAPMIAAETMTFIGPYIPVAEKVATLATQLSAGQMGTIEIDYLGEIATFDTTPLRAAVIKGLLEPIAEEKVTIVNANLVAEQRGMRIVERKGPAEKTYANLIRVHIHGSHGDTDVTGTVGHAGPLIVQINEFWIDIPFAQGWLLLCENQDRPGMIGAVGTYLGQHDINISFMNVGRINVRGRALMAVAIDDPISEEQLEELAAIPNILSARVAKFA